MLDKAGGEEKAQLNAGPILLLNRQYFQPRAGIRGTVQAA